MKKFLIRLFLVLYLIFNVFFYTNASIVSDNDGSAFITKAEFDNLKNNFADQIDNYNDSINRRIDGAIGSYLAGINLTVTPTNLYTQFIDKSGDKPYFLQSIDSGSSAVTAKWNKQSKTSINAEVCNNLKYDLCWMEFPYGECSTHVLNTHIAVTCGDHGYNPSTGFENRMISNDGGMEYRHGNYTCADINPTLTYSPDGTAASKATFSKKQYSASTVTQESGSGSGWIYQVLNGKKVLKYYCTQLYPQYDTLIESHYYNKFALNNQNYFNSTGKSLTPTWTERSISAEYGKTKSVGNRKSSTDTTSDTYAQIRTSLVKTTDGSNYMYSLFSADSDWILYSYNEDYIGNGVATSSKEVTGDTLTWYDTYYTGFGGKVQTNTLTGGKGKFTPLKFSPETLHISDFSIDLLTSLSGINTYQGNGMPILKANSSDTDTKIKIKFKATDNNVKNIKVIMSDKPLKLGSIDTANHASELVNETIQTNIEKTYNIELGNKDQCLWIFVKNNTDNKAIIIDSFDLS